MAPLAIDHITLPAFTEYLSRYASLVPDKLDDLDALRYDSIPGLLANRKQNDDAFLKPWEVLKLVEWKLYVHHLFFLFHFSFVSKEELVCLCVMLCLAKGLRI